VRSQCLGFRGEQSNRYNIGLFGDIEDMKQGFENLLQIQNRQLEHYRRVAENAQLNVEKQRIYLEQESEEREWERVAYLNLQKTSGLNKEYAYSLREELRRVNSLLAESTAKLQELSLASDTKGEKLSFYEDAIQRADQNASDLHAFTDQLMERLLSAEHLCTSYELENQKLNNRITVLEMSHILPEEHDSVQRKLIQALEESNQWRLKHRVIEKQMHALTQQNEAILAASTPGTVTPSVAATPALARSHQISSHSSDGLAHVQAALQQTVVALKEREVALMESERALEHSTHPAPQHPPLPPSQVTAPRRSLLNLAQTATGFRNSRGAMQGRNTRGSGGSGGRTPKNSASLATTPILDLSSLPNTGFHPSMVHHATTTAAADVSSPSATSSEEKERHKDKSNSARLLGGGITLKSSYAREKLKQNQSSALSASTRSQLGKERHGPTEFLAHYLSPRNPRLPEKHEATPGPGDYDIP
jgi:hypothetical protein